MFNLRSVSTGMLNKLRNESDNIALFRHYKLIALLPVLLPSKYIRFCVFRILYLVFHTGYNQLNSVNAKQKKEEVL